MQRRDRQALRRSSAPSSGVRRPLVSLDIEADRIELVPIELDGADHRSCEGGERCDVCQAEIRAEALRWLRDLNASPGDAPDPAYAPWQSHLPGDVG